MERCEADRFINLFGVLTVEEFLRLDACAAGPCTDEVVVVGLGTELPVVEDIIEMRLSQEDEGRPLFAPVSCVEASPAMFEGEFASVCRRRRSLLLCDKIKLGLDSAVSGPFPVRSRRDPSNL